MVTRSHLLQQNYLNHQHSAYPYFASVLLLRSPCLTHETVSALLPGARNGGGYETLQRRCATPDMFPAFNSTCRYPSCSYRRLVALAVAKRSPKRLKYSSPRFTKEDGLLYVEVDPMGSGSWKLEPVVELLKAGAVGVIPTDTVYAITCDLRNFSAIERLRRIKDVEPSKPLSILCHSFEDIDTYTTGFPRGNGQGLMNIFRAVKHCLPGPYTFILTASKELPKQCIRYGTTTSKYASRKNVGVRMPDDVVCQKILEKMEAPLISTSVRSPKENEWILDPVLIADVYGPEEKISCKEDGGFVLYGPSEGLDFVVAAGSRVSDPSTVVDMTGDLPQITRQGKGPRQPWMIAEHDEEESLVNEAKSSIRHPSI